MWILCGSCVNPMWILWNTNLSSMGSVWILYESCVNPMWILCESCVNPLWTESYVNTLWILCESFVNPVWILCESCVNPMWILCESCESYVNPMCILWILWSSILFRCLRKKGLVGIWVSAASGGCGRDARLESWRHTHRQECKIKAFFRNQCLGPLQDCKRTAGPHPKGAALHKIPTKPFFRKHRRQHVCIITCKSRLQHYHNILTTQAPVS